MKRFAFGPFVLDPSRGALLRDGRPVQVNQKGILLLTALLRTAGEAVGKEALMEAAWPGMAVEESNLSVQIAALRKLLGEGGEWIATVPRVGYRFTGTVTDPARENDEASDAPESRPLIAVLPFGIVSDESGKDYLADGITDDIITALARYRWFRVLVRGSAFSLRGPIDVREAAQALGVRYVLQGNVRHSAQRLRISAQLIDASDGSHLWAERYDLDAADVFAIQDEIAERVVGAIEPEILKTESQVATRRHTGNMTAWHLVRQGMWHFHKITREDHLTARELFRRACALDPALPESHIWLGRVSAGIIAYGWSEAVASHASEGISAGARAIALDPRDPYAHYAFAIANAYGGEPAAAVTAAETAIALSSSFALGHLMLGMARLFAGQPRDAIAPLEHGLTLNPHDPQNVAWYNLLAHAQLLAGEPSGALATTNRALAVRPTFRPTFETLICCHVILGHSDEARRVATRINGLTEESHFLDPVWRSQPDWAARRIEMLRSAGV
jgi:TolB-like protein